MDLSALFTLSYGLYVVGTRSGDKLNGQISNAVFQITSDPVRIALGINRTELTHELITSTGRCCVAVLDQTADLPYIGKFGFRTGRDVDKFDGVPYGTAPSGCPFPLEHVLAWMDLEIVDSVDVDTHTLFIGKLTGCAITGVGTPMTYSHYREVLCGKTPPTAPSHVSSNTAAEEDSGRGPVKMQSYVCGVCGYIYDPEAGDPEGKIPPGTPFEDVPDNWTCPVCGVGKAQFEPI
jgi:rubredoxin/flavin reductase (DIM6/NTAB) family NADH-FMN oxidoreductase RutF